MSLSFPNIMFQLCHIFEEFTRHLCNMMWFISVNSNSPHTQISEHIYDVHYCRQILWELEQLYERSCWLLCPHLIQHTQLAQCYNTKCFGNWICDNVSHTCINMSVYNNEMKWAYDVHSYITTECPINVQTEKF